MLNLDLKDRKILFELELNARIPETQLAKKTGLSREVVAYRLKKLEERKIILKYHAIVNSMNLGKLMYRTYFKLQKTTPGKEQEFVQYLLHKFNWITKVRGVWDVGTMIFVDSNYDFDEIMRDILSDYGEYIENYWFAIMTRLHHCKRSYLLGKEDNTNIILEKAKHQIKTDELDIKIINYLTLFGRAKYQEMAKKFNVNEKLIRDRLERLMENKIILAFTTFLNIPLLDIKYYKLHFTLNDKSREIIKKMIAFGLAQPNIVYVVEGTGCADVEVEVQVQSITELYAIIDIYRSTFKEAIRDYVFMEYTEEYKFEYAK
ncbi:Lrp/AsnC family transcriptional regulator [Candidatus Woesearchaeota archaeon]|nr:Lrp/AsnC family transcriptional regulator [Candidatus Woesearchaeota archaeon]